MKGNSKPVADLRPLLEAYALITAPVFGVSLGNLQIALANRAALKLTGHNRADLEGKSFLQLFLEEDRAKVAATLGVGKEIDNFAEFNLRLLKKSGTILWVNLTGTQISLGPDPFIVFTVQDITPLKKFYEELEEKVQIRTADLNASQNHIRRILNSSLQGFLTFSQDLKIEPDYSAKAEEFLGSELSGRNICDVLNLNRQMFTEFSNLAFHSKNWEVLERLAIMESKVEGRILKLEFAPVIEDQQITRILVAVTDITPLKRLEQRAEKFAKETRAIIKILQSKPVFLELIRVVSEMKDSDEEAAKRHVHTLKGEFSFFECQDLVELCEFWEGKWNENYHSGDLALFLKQFRAALGRFLYKYRNLLRLSPSDQTDMIVPIERIRSLISKMNDLDSPPALFAEVESIIERPIEECLEWLGETWLMVASRLGKKVNPLVWKKSLSIFEAPYKKLFFSLVHAVRNSADHGIETPEERLAAGKPENGNLYGELERVDNFYHLRLKDDGKGVQLSAIKARAMRKGLTIPALEEEVYNLLFIDRMSSRDAVTEVSGRGIGLNAIRSEARALEGDATVRNVPGGGLELHVWFKRIAIFDVINLPKL